MTVDGKAGRKQILLLAWCGDFYTPLRHKTLIPQARPAPSLRGLCLPTKHQSSQTDLQNIRGGRCTWISLKHFTFVFPLSFFSPGVADTQICSLGTAGYKWIDVARDSTLGKCQESCRKSKSKPNKSYLNACIKITSGQPICELHARDQRVTSIILNVMAKPMGSTSDEWEIDHPFWTDPTIF